MLNVPILHSKWTCSRSPIRVIKSCNLTLSLETFENGLHAKSAYPALKSELAHEVNEVHINTRLKGFFKGFIIQGHLNVTDLDGQVHVVGTSGHNLPPKP